MTNEQIDRFAKQVAGQLGRQISGSEYIDAMSCRIALERFVDRFANRLGDAIGTKIAAVLDKHLSED